jgi:hypothetical protein
MSASFKHLRTPANHSTSNILLSTTHVRHASHAAHAKRYTSLRILTILGILFGMLAPFAPQTTYGASVIRAEITAGGFFDPATNTYYTKQGQELTLAVTTSSATRCVELSGAHTATQTSNADKSSWTFSVTAGAGDGVKTITATAYGNNGCNNSPGSGTVSYALDNTGPVVTGTLHPLPNTAGWNNSDVSITWSANDSGSGLDTGPTPAMDSVTANGTVTKTASSIDRLGNVGSGSVTVKLDKAAPSIIGNQSPTANEHGWNNSDVAVAFTCSDTLSGIKSCTNSTTLSSEGMNQEVSGTAVDNADNSSSTTVRNINIDKTVPTLSGAPTTEPNNAGWYNANVTIAWSASDALSGLDGAAPANSTISGEGEGLTASASVKDKAGNTTSAISNPVRIDKTAPATTVTAPAGWKNADVTVNLHATDALSGVKASYYILNNGDQLKHEDEIVIRDEGIHNLEFWSEDNAGNVEEAQHVQVKIDKGSPKITHTQSPEANEHGWSNQDVTVTFTCEDNVSGIASCTEPQTVTTEGQNQLVLGTAVNHAGNSVDDPATVSIDKIAPTISATADRAANGNGWYNADMTVSFACGDMLSGIDECPVPKTLGEGANQSTSGTATDAAGNIASGGVSGINVDKTAPTLSGTPSATAWSRGDVTVAWNCGDNLSGIDGECPGDSTVTGEGDNLSATTSVSDLAGNVTTTTIGHIKIDRTAPYTTASLPELPASGWYKGAVEVTLKGSDNLSGIAKSYYRLDDGAVQEYSAPFNLDVHGIHTITFWSVDNAGNVEDNEAPGHSIEIKIDNVKPTISGSRTPAANTFGWNNSMVNVSFTCADEASGLAHCEETKVVQSEGAGQSVTGVAIDNVGNKSTATVSNINIDRTPPTLDGEPTTSANANGWYQGDVVIKWAAKDSLSGIDPSTLPANSTITGEGNNLGTGPVSVADKAGNSANASVSGIQIDRTNPLVAITSSVNGGNTSNESASVRVTASDLVSGIAKVTLNGATAIKGDGNTYSANVALACGVNTINAQATDHAGRQSSAQVTITRDCLQVYIPLIVR